MNRLPPTAMDHAVFRGASERALAPLRRAAVLRELAPTELLVEEGAPQQHTWLVTDGALHAFCGSASGLPVTMFLLTPGDLFGHLAKIHSRGYVMGVGALRPSSALGFPLEDFRRFVESHPPAALELETQVGRKVSELAHLRRLGFDPALLRVCLAVEHLEKRLGDKVPVDRNFLASMTGLAPETVSRCLTELKGAVRLQRGTLHVLDKAELRRRAVAEGAK